MARSQDARSRAERAGATPDLPVGELADAFGTAAKLLGRTLTERLDSHGDSMPRFRLLVELVQNGPLRLTELANRVGASQGPTSAHVEVLVQEGLVDRATDPNDKRATTLAASRVGSERAQAWLADYEAVAGEMFASLSADQRLALRSILDILISSNANQQHR